MEEKEKIIDSWIKETVKDEKDLRLKSDFTAHVMSAVMNPQKSMSKRKLWFLVPFSIIAIVSLVYFIGFTPFGEKILSFVNSINLFSFAEDFVSPPVLIGLALYLIGARVVIGILLVKRIGFHWRIT